MKKDSIRYLSIYDLLNMGSDSTRFFVPPYQRNYDWEDENCEILLEDILSAVDNNKEHFFGSIYTFRESASDGVDNYIVIDGQQRLTTIFLILQVIMVFDEYKNDEALKTRLFLRQKPGLNIQNQQEIRLRLKLIKTDNTEFEKISSNDFESVDKKSNVYKIYNFLKERITSEIVDKVKVGLEKLMIVWIQLEKEDNPQEIFESLNSKGMPLDTSDLIRNFLLMVDRNAENLYEKYWVGIETRIKDATKENGKNDKKGKANLKRFFRDYLIEEKCQEILETKVYKTFVYNLKGQDKEILLRNLLDYAMIYAIIISGNYNSIVGIKNDEELFYYLRVLSQIDITVARPFLLRMFYDLKKGLAETEDVKNTVKLLLQWFLRMKICSIETKGLNKEFPKLCNRSNGKDYFSSLVEFIQDAKKYNCSNDRLEESLRNSDFYDKKKANFIKVFLGVINNSSADSLYSNDYRDFTECSIDHIIPQETSTWEPFLKSTYGIDWKEVFELEYKDKLGNLTLVNSKDNSAQSNSAPEYKLKWLTEHSHNFSSILTDGWLGKDSFSFEAISERTERLITRFKSILDMHLPEKANDISSEVKTLDSNLTNAKIKLAFIDGHKLDIDGRLTYSNWFKSIVMYVFSSENYKNKAHEILSKKKLKFITTNKQDFKQENVHYKNFVSDGTEIFIFTYGSNERIKELVRQFLSAIAPELIPTVKIYCEN